jgi:hypothetical protein
MPADLWVDRWVNRRGFLRVGSAAAGALGLNWVPQSVLAADNRSRLLTGKSVVFLFMHGGPSQIETFDPKPEAPVEVRSTTDDIATAVPGIRFGGTFPLLAQRADRFTIVRSFVTGDGNHDIKPVVGRATGGASLGALYARVAGGNHPRTGLPTNLLLYPRSVDPTTGPEVTGFGRFDSTGPYGAGAAPFIPGAGSEVQQNLELRMSADRLGDRRTLIHELDRYRRKLGESTYDPLLEQAFETLTAGIAGVFDLSREDPHTIARYDTAPLVRPDQIEKQWNNYNHYVDHAKSLGKLLLLARRLCEAGAGFVTVTTSFVWDMHSDVNNAPPHLGMKWVGTPFDHAVSAFIDDLDARGLSDRVLLVCCGEMGRTPRLNAKAGRDHWGNLAPLLLAGAGIPRGGVIGQSARDAGQPLSEPVTIPHLVATILQTLFRAGELRLQPGIPDDILRAANHEPIPGLNPRELA